jgi:TonB-dependent receptor
LVLNFFREGLARGVNARNDAAKWICHAQLWLGAWSSADRIAKRSVGEKAGRKYMPNHRKAESVEGRKASVASLLLQGASLFALCAISMSGPAFAQDAVDDAASDEEIVVTGIRSSLRSSQEIKRTANVFVDSITAEDIGALPDRSVTEALQRIPGVSVSRFAAAVDPDHFSVEGSGVVIRGLNFVRSEFNGRDAFTANNGRALSFADVPAELAVGVDVFKNQSADMIEGGLAGTVNIRTRVPFDAAGRLISGSIEASYGDLIEDWAPTFSVLYSDRFDTSAGEFGIMLNYVDNQLVFRNDAVQVSGYGCRPIQNGQPNDCATNPRPYFARGARMASQEWDRTRIGEAVAAQWASPDDTMLATFQFLRSEASQSWSEHAIEIATDNVNGACLLDGGNVDHRNPANGRNCDARPVAGTSFTYDSDQVFTDGVITGPTGWKADGNYYWSGGPNGPVAGGGNTRNGGQTPCTTNAGCDPRSPYWGLQSNNIRRDVEQTYVTEDTGFNFRWTPNESWRFNFDWQHVKSTVENLDVSLWGSTFQNLELHVNGDDLPEFTFLPPDQTTGGGPGSVAPIGAPFQCATGAGYASNPPGAAPGPGCTTYFDANHANFSDPYNSFWRAAMDHAEDSEGQEDAIRFDIDRSFEDAGWLQSIRVGARWSERDQITRFSTYNWSVLSEIWGGNGPVWFDETADGVANANGLPDRSGTPTSAMTELFAWDNWMRGDIANPLGTQFVPMTNFNVAQNYEQFMAFTGRAEDPLHPGSGIAGEWQACGPSGGNAWQPLATRDQNCDGVYDNNTPLAQSMGLPGTYFVPQEINPINEVTNAFYAMLNFGSDVGDTMFNGNIGLRYVTTNRQSTGAVAFPSGAPSEASCLPPPALPPGQVFTPSAFCQLPTATRDATRAWANAAINVNSFDFEYEYWLPSFNLKVELTEDFLLRFGASRAITLPEVGLTRAFFTIGLDVSEDSLDANNQQPIGTVGAAGNPQLLPIQSTNLDASAEWYFADVGSLTFSVFYKELDDVITNGTVRAPFTNNGQTFDVVYTGPINSEDTGKVKGFELAYQQFYDFLPAPFDGFGINANYTYVDSSGVEQSTLSPTDSNVAAGRVAIIDTSLLPLAGLSEHNVNFAAIYENGPLSARLAYAWRSEYLLTVRDVITPYAPIMNESTGQLDGSIFFTVNDHLKFGVQGANLTNEVTRTSQVLDDSLLRAGRSWFMNDRRVTFIARATF